MARMVTVTDMDHGWAKAIDGMAKINGANVEVGIFADQGAHPHGDGILISEVAADNEFGTEAIPSRPFLRQTYATNQNRYADQAVKVLAAVIRGRLSVDQGLQTMGAIQASDVKTTINSWSSPANSAATIRRKGKNDPLVDSGVMRDSVMYKKHGGGS